MHPTNAVIAKDGLAVQPRLSCVLLVEDDATVAMIVEKILLDMGLQTLVVSTLDYVLVEVELADFDAAASMRINLSKLCCTTRSRSSFLPVATKPVFGRRTRTSP